MHESYSRPRRLWLTLPILLSLCSAPLWADDAAALVRDIQTGLSAIKRHTVTQPGKAEEALAQVRPTELPSELRSFGT